MQSKPIFKVFKGISKFYARVFGKHKDPIFDEISSLPSYSEVEEELPPYSLVDETNQDAIGEIEPSRRYLDIHDRLLLQLERGFVLISEEEMDTNLLLVEHLWEKQRLVQKTFPDIWTRIENM